MSWGLVLGGLSLINNIIQGNKAQKSANNAAKRAGKLTDRQVALFDQMLGMVNAADASGQFDPTRRLDQLRTDTAEYEGRDLGNLAGAMKVAGYRPGDTEIGGRLDAVKLKYRQDYNRMANDIRDSTFASKIAAYSAINPSQLNSAISQANRSQEMAMAQANANNPANFLGALMPFLNGGGGGGGGGTATPNMSLGTGGYMNFQPGVGYEPGGGANGWQLPVAWNPRPTYGR